MHCRGGRASGPPELLQVVGNCGLPDMGARIHIPLEHQCAMVTMTERHSPGGFHVNILYLNTTELLTLSPPE